MKYKWAILISIIAITGIVISDILFVIEHKIENENNFEEIADQFTNQSINSLELWVQEQIRMAKNIAEDNRIIEMCLEPENNQKLEIAEDYLVKLHNKYPYYENLPVSIILDKPITREINNEVKTIKNTHFLIDTVNGKTVGKGGMDYSYIYEIVNGKDFYVSEAYPSILRENPIIVISAPVIKDNKLIGIAMVSPQVDYFTKLFVDSIKLGETGYMFFLDQEGIFISHSDRELILLKDDTINNNAKIIVNNIEENRLFFKENLYKEEKFYYGKKLDFDLENFKQKGYIVFTQNKDEVYKNLGDFIKVLVIANIFSISFIVGGLLVIFKIHSKNQREEYLIKTKEELEKKVEERTVELKKMATIDGLTGLRNFKNIHEKLEEIISDDNISTVSVALGDLDHFKAVNDTFGHQKGDEVLREISKIIRYNIRENDLAGRYGGEEFLLVFPNLEINKAYEVCERIRIQMENHRFCKGALRVTISFGVTECTGEGTEAIIKRADKLLYVAKGKGRNIIEKG